MSFDKDTWQLALDKWNEVSKEIGFEDRKIAFLQGFYIGHRQAAKTTISEEEFIKMFKDLCKDAYAARSAGDMWEADRYRFWYEKFITKKENNGNNGETRQDEDLRKSIVHENPRPLSKSPQQRSTSTDRVKKGL